MTAQATQSNNALGRRSLPSSFFAPLQTLGRYYMERQRVDGSSPDDIVPDSLSADPALDSITEAVADPAMELEPAAGFASTAFADVARRVWSEAGPELRTADRAAAAAPTRNRQLDSQPNAQRKFQTVAGHGPEEAHALAHDASNLLSALRLYSELLCFSGVLHERHRHYAEDLKLLSLRSERLIGRLVALAEQVALTGDRPAMEETSSQESSLGPVLIRLRGLLGTLAHGALEVDLGTQARLPVAVPEDVLERILVNLVSNAAAAIRGGGSIRIRAGVQCDPSPSVARDSGEDSGGDSMVVLTVDDSGCGMSEAQVQAALGLDVQGGVYRSGQEPEREHGWGRSLGRDVRQGSGDDLRPEQSGPGRTATLPIRRHGLGLSIVRELVAANRGRLFIQSRPGTGTRIEIHWKTAASAPLAGETGYAAIFPKAGSGEFTGVRQGIARAGTRAATRAEREAEGAVA